MKIVETKEGLEAIDGEYTNQTQNDQYFTSREEVDNLLEFRSLVSSSFVLEVEEEEENIEDGYSNAGEDENFFFVLHTIL